MTSPRTRTSTVLTGLCAGALLVAALSTPSLAAYPNQPAPQSWTPPGPVHAVLATAKRVYVAGASSGGAGVIAALQPSTGRLLWQVATDGDVRALAVSTNGRRLFAGGQFQTVSGIQHKHLVALTSSKGSAAPWNASASGEVLDLLVVGQTLYVGGSFDSIGQHQQRGLGAVTTDTGRRVKAFKASVNLRVESLARHGQNLLVAGRFVRVNGRLRASLAKVSLSTGKLASWSPVRVCATCTTYWDVVADAHNAYVASSGPGGNVGAYSLSTGKRAWPVVHADGDVQALALAPDGLLYLGGHFNKFVGSAGNHRTQLAALRPSTGHVNAAFHPRMYTPYPGVWALAATSTRLYAGGSFTGVQAHGSNNNEPYLARFGP